MCSRYVFTQAEKLSLHLRQFIRGTAAKRAPGFYQFGLGLLDLGLHADQGLPGGCQLGAYLLKRTLLVDDFQLTNQLFGGELAGDGGFFHVQLECSFKSLNASLSLRHFATRLQ